MSLPVRIDELSAASIASAGAHMVVVTGGLAKRTTLGEATYGYFNATLHFGVTGDGSTDNVTALYAMRDYLRTLNCPVTVTFPPGTYLYSKNQWTKGINDLTLNLSGSTLKCTSTSATDFDTNPFTGNQGVFNNSGYDTYSAASTLFGYKFGTVESGSSTLTTSTASDAGNFSAGNKVLIYGYGQQDVSFPPNPRYFEYNEVVTAVAGTGIITLKNPLKNTYHASWHDFSQGKGAPRIQNLSRASTDFTFCKRLVINGGSFVINPNGSTTNYVQIEGYETVILNGVKGDGYFVPSMCQYVEAINCDFAFSEQDKIIESVTLNGGRYGGIAGATGVETLKLKGGVLIQGTSSTQAKNFIVEGATFNSLASSSYIFGLSTSYAMILADFRSAEFKIKDSAATALVNGGLETSFTISSASSNSKVLVSCANETAFETVYQQLHIGFTYQLQDGTKRVRITKIYDEDATHAAIEGEFTATAVGAEVYRGANIQEIRIGSISQSGTYAPIKAINFARQQYQEIKFRDRSFQQIVLTEHDLYRAASAGAILPFSYMIRGRVINVVVLVNKVYSGVDATSQLFVQKSLPTATVTYATINTKTAGLRQITPYSTHGAVSGDTLVATAAGHADTVDVWIEKFGGAYPTYANATELPNFTILIEYLKAL